MLRFKAFVGPKSYYFVDPDHGYRFEASTKGDLLQQINKYRSQNRLPRLDHIDDVIENFLCMQPENQWSCEEAPIKRGLFQYFKGGVGLLSNVLFKRFATQEVAESRASVCVKCPYNVFPDKTGFIEFADRLAEASTLGRRVSLHDELGNCDVCTCSMRSKVFYGEKISLSEEERSKMEELKKTHDIHCWQLDK